MKELSPVTNPFVGFPTQYDLKLFDGQIAIIGIPYQSPYDKLPSYSTLNAPDAVRMQSEKYEQIDHYDFDFDGDLMAGKAIKCFDCGNLINDEEKFENYSKTVSQSIRTLSQKEVVPIIIGGDHGTTIPVLKGFESVADLCVVQIDAHLDWIDEKGGVRDGYSSPMRRAAEMDNVSSVVQIGLRSQGSATQKEVDAANASDKTLLIKAEELHKTGIETILNRIPKASAYFITIDADGLDPSIAPGCGYPTPGGVEYYQLFNLMRGLARKGKMVGMDFVEIVPENDVVNLTSLFAARQILNFIGILAHGGQFD
jgi:agmatinase